MLPTYYWLLSITDDQGTIRYAIRTKSYNEGDVLRAFLAKNPGIQAKSFEIEEIEEDKVTLLSKLDIKFVDIDVSRAVTY